MKKIVNKNIKYKAILVLMILCLVPVFVQRSLCLSSDNQTKIYNAVNQYYNSIAGKKHTMTVSLSQEEFTERINQLTARSEELIEQESASNINDVYEYFKGPDPENPDLASAAIYASYIKIKWETDKLFTEVPTKPEGNLTVKYGTSENNYEKYFIYEMCKEPENDGKYKAYTALARDVKIKVERLILLYSVSKDNKYLAALKSEIVAAAKWKNNWQSSQYIDTAEIAYAVSLGYDFAYNSLTTTQRCVIENRLLFSVLLYGTGNSAGIKKLNGNFNQVGHSGLGIAALTLLYTSNQGVIKVLSSDSKTITIKYPVKSIDKNDKVTILYDYSDILLNNSGGAKITNEELVALLKNKIQVNTSGQYIKLKDLYSAIIVSTMDYMPRVTKSSNVGIDGTYPEGMNYLLYGMRYYSYYLATLRNTLKLSDWWELPILNFENDKVKSKVVLNNLALSAVYLSNSRGNNFAFGDSTVDTTEQEDDLFYLANFMAENKYHRSAKVIYDYRTRIFSKKIDDTKKGKWGWGFYSIMWYKSDNDPKNTPIDYEAVYNSNIYHNKYVEAGKENKNINIRTAVFNENYADKNAIFTAIRGGDTTTNHTHLDLGTFVYYSNGTNWIDDIGNGDYNGLKYHDKEYLRWQYYATRAEAHSTIVVNTPNPIDRGSKGTCLAADQWIGAKAKFEKFDSSKSTGIATLDISQAYNKSDNDEPNKGGSTNTNTVHRGLKIYNNKKYVLIQDEVSLKNVVSYYSMVNVGKGGKNTSSAVNTVEIKDEGKKAILTDYKGQKLTLILKSTNKSLKFKMIKELDPNRPHGYLNNFLKTGQNDNVSLKLNDEKVNLKKLVVYLHNSSSTGANIDMKYGIFIIPGEVQNNDEIDEDLLQLVDLKDWYIPTPPTIKVLNKKYELSNGDTISGSAVIKINDGIGKKANEIIRYSLDNGNTWYEYDNDDPADIQRRTISEIGSHLLTVKAYVDAGSGIKGDESSLTDFNFNIQPSETYTIHKYTVDEEKKYIDMIDPMTSQEAFSNNITLGNDYSLMLNIGDKNYIYTGSITKIQSDNDVIAQYTNIVRGDTNGDGKITSLDYVKIKNHIMDTNQILEDVIKRAADANTDNEISSLDYVRIKNIIMDGE